MANAFVASRSGKNALTLLLSLAIVYFLYHFVQGDLGIVSMLRSQKHLEIVTQQHEELVLERQHLELRNALLGSNGNSIDADLLDEQARKILGLAHPDELVIYPN
ncbi:MAG: septum formation initiator family protein [SAR116 cluster bacterium]|jgi:Septum formation initiator|nr:septum formation inhibitor [Paracoccaceae bacterium]RCL81236.1 MAG: septum formation initiator family protein [SAR116 cluster bacterium]RPH14353.1 MAG: septum formation initiator family protein [Alphaproteobacteria bacterium TMED150]HCJ62123.1 septum formation inhibitor [Alphaproteobacteria bacterium]|tara:strand:+ start:1401 stop:1715 length:315 start_codon:yes stop_codon:yes gene_type:complete